MVLAFDFQFVIDVIFAYILKDDEFMNITRLISYRNACWFYYAMMLQHVLSQ